MSVRGSFTQCAYAMGALFSQHRYDLLHIVHNAEGKYYTLFTDDELIVHKAKNEYKEDRVVVSLTRKEMRLLYDNKQRDLFS